MHKIPEDVNSYENSSPTTQKEYSEDGYLEKIKPTEQIKNLYLELKDAINKAFPNVKFEQKKAYMVYSLDNLPLGTIDMKRSLLYLTYKAGKKSIIGENSFVKRSNTGRMGGDYYYSQVESTQDIEKVILVIEEVHQIKLGQ